MKRESCRISKASISSRTSRNWITRCLRDAGLHTPAGARHRPNEVPVILENHTKDIRDFSHIERFIKDVSQAADIRCLTLTELARELQAEDSRLREPPRFAMNMRSELISQALNERFTEFCGERVSQSRPKNSARWHLSSRASVNGYCTPRPPTSKLDAFSHPAGEMDGSDADCLAFLRALCLEQQLPLRRAQHPPVDSFVKTLSDCRNDTARRFSLLAERYACPLNFRCRRKTQCANIC